uniref:DUF834 domain-containing protein n=1 Tax=Oryza meridionalis TaxID=40149 RepID=A0A0E0EJB2_9ORYZ
MPLGPHVSSPSLFLSFSLLSLFSWSRLARLRRRCPERALTRHRRPRHCFSRRCSGVAAVNHSKIRRRAVRWLGGRVGAGAVRPPRHRRGSGRGGAITGASRRAVRPVRRSEAGSGSSSRPTRKRKNAGVVEDSGSGVGEVWLEDGVTVEEVSWRTVTPSGDADDERAAKQGHGRRREEPPGNRARRAGVLRHHGHEHGVEGEAFDGTVASSSGRPCSHRPVVPDRAVVRVVVWRVVRVTGGGGGALQQLGQINNDRTINQSGKT